MKQIFLTFIFYCVLIGTVHAETSQYGNWTQAGPVPPFGPRAFYGSAVFHDQIFVIGGQNTGPRTPDPESYAIYNDVWSTTDGTNWTELTANASFSQRTDPRVAVFNDKLWVIGGYSVSSLRNDVWSSSDGRNWSLVTANADFSPRSDPVVVVFDNKLWVIGGQDYQSNLVNDVWFSSDGSNWVLITDNAGFSRSLGYILSGTVFDNHIFIFDVIPNKESWGTNAVWSSSDGKMWTVVNSNATFRVMKYKPMTVSNGRFWIIGGGNPGIRGTPEMTTHPEKYVYFNSVWSSVDGISWTLETEHAGFSPRYGMGVISFQNKIWVLGGFPNAVDVWYLPLLTLTSSNVPSTSNPSVSGTSARTTIGSIFPVLSLVIVAGICAYCSRAGKR